MTNQRVVLIGLLIILSSGVIWTTVDRALTVYPTIENQSGFLQSYTPAHAIDQFRKLPTDYLEGVSEGSEAGHGFATHHKEFERNFIIASGDWVALANAVHHDIEGRLKAARARIVEETGNPVDRFKIIYQAGKTEGSVAVDRLQSVPNSPLGGAAGLRAGEAEMTLRIQIDEKWSKSGA